MRVAGRYAAWEAAGDIVVYDRATSSEAYRIPDVWPGIYDDKSLDLQADGKIAFHFRKGLGRRFEANVAWASPAEPFAHRLPVSDDGTYVVKMDNDRVVFVRDAARLVSKPRHLITRTGELGMVGLTGGERVLARPVESSAFGEFFDFDGGRVAWQERTCQGAQLRVQTLDALIARPRLRSAVHPRRCRFRLLRDARYLRRKHRLPFDVDCTGFREDCITLDPVLRTLRAYRVNGRRVPAGTRVSDGTIKVTDTQDAFEFTPVGRQLILRPGRIRFGIRTDISDTLVAELRRGRITVR